MLFFKVDPGNSFSSSIDSSDLSSANIDPACTQEPSDVPTEEPTQVPTEITYSLQSIATSDHHLNHIDGNYFYYVAIMDNNNNGDSGAECYDVDDISDIRINKSFLQEGSSNSVIFHAEDFLHHHHEYTFYADIFPMKRNNFVTNTIDKVLFDISRMILVSSHTSLYSSLYTTQVLYTPHQVISPNIICLWPTSLLFTKFSSSSVSFRYGIPFSYHNPKATGGGTGQIRFQFRLQFNFRLRFRIIIDSITTMVATIIPVFSSSSLQGDTSVVPTDDLNHSPSDVPRSILDPVSTNATTHPCLI